MRLRTQLAIAFFLLAVVPLLGVTLYTWLGSQRAFRQAVAAEAGSLATEMSLRVDLVADQLKERLQRMADRPSAGAETQKARREALAAAEGEELRLLLRAILSSAERRQGAIPFALDREGRLYAPDPADEAVLAELGVAPGVPATRRDAGDWVVGTRSDEETGIRIGVARPVGPALTGDPAHRRPEPRPRPGARGGGAPRHPPALAAHDAASRLAHRGRRAARRRATSTCRSRCPTGGSSGTSR